MSFKFVSEVKSIFREDESKIKRLIKIIYFLFIRISKRCLSLCNIRAMLNKLGFGSLSLVGEIAALFEKGATLDDVAKMLHSKKEFFRPRAAISLMLNLFNYIEWSKAHFPVFSQGHKKTYIIHTCSWGKAYTNKVIKHLIPCLLSRDNLPALCKDYHIVFWIHCDRKSKEELNNSEEVGLLSNHADVKIEVIPSKILYKLKRVSQPLIGIKNVCYKYYLLGTMQNIAMLVAQHNKALI